MSDALHYEHWVDRFAGEDEPVAAAIAERLTALRVLRAFINEAVIACEGTAGVLSRCDGMPGLDHVRYPGASTFLLSLRRSDELLVLVAGLDECGELASIHEVHALDEGVVRPLTLTVASMCERLGIPEDRRPVLTSNVHISVEAARRWRRPRPDAPSLARADRERAYIHFEQDCNLIRSTINPVPYSFVGDPAHHPLLRDEPSLEVPLFESRGGRLDYAAATPSHDAGEAMAALRRAGAGAIRMPVHPQSLECFRATRPALVADLRPIGSLSGYPTASIRTLLHAGSPSFHVKCSYAGQITSRPRFLYRPEAINALRTTRVLLQVEQAGRWPSRLHVLPDIAMVSHRDDATLTAVFRAGLADAQPVLAPTDLVVPSFSLLSPRYGSPERLVDELVSRAGLAPERYFAELAELLVHGHLGLAELGITHETHAQNALFVCDRATWRMRALCLRDMESSKISKGMLARHGITSEHVNSPDARETRSMVVLEEGDRASLRYFFTYHYCLMVESQLVPVADHLATRHGLDRRELAEQCQRLYVGWWRARGTTFREYASLMEPTPLRRNVLAVGLGLAITGVPNRRLTTPHPFFPSYARMMRELPA